MSEIADFLRARYAEIRKAEEARRWINWEPGMPCPRCNRPTEEMEDVRDSASRWIKFRPCGHAVYDPEGIAHYEASAADPAVLADLDAKLAIVDELEPPPLAEPEPNAPQTGWCCNGHAAECPLCLQYGTRLLDPCPGHPGTGANKTRIVEAQLHACHAHPGYEYRTTEGPRKQWDGVDDPPLDDDGESGPGWERNIDAGRAGMGWERFDYTEESYWRRPRPGGPQHALVPRILRLLAQPFAGHPDHKGGEWAVE